MATDDQIQDQPTKGAAIDAALLQADRGRFISSAAMNAWIDHWDTEDERPMPQVDISSDQG